MVWVVLLTYSFISFVVSFSHGGTLWGEDEWCSGDSTRLPVDRCHTWVDFTVGSPFYTVWRISGLWRFFWWKIEDFLEPFPKQTLLFQTQDYNLKQSIETLINTRSKLMMHCKHTVTQCHVDIREFWNFSFCNNKLKVTCMEESCESCQAETATQKLVNNQCDRNSNQRNKSSLCCSAMFFHYQNLCQILRNKLLILGWIQVWIWFSNVVIL